MPTWQEDYLGALEARDASEKADQETINAYTRLADEHAAMIASNPVVRDSPLTKQVVQNLQPSASPNKTTRIPPALLGSDLARSPSPTTSAKGGEEVRLRADLTSANRNLQGLNNQILALRNDIEKLGTDAGARDVQLSELGGSLAQVQAEKLALGRKLRDRESELREKARLVGEVQDEMVSLEMQLNVAEERSKRLERENGELVERWMRRMGREADAMNEGSGW